MSRYHKAAIDGYLDLLKEATRKDLNTPDEDGMTPTLWAAFHGNAEALQLICSRGGDPDKSDIWGNTPLHHAATNGHMHILVFLVNFGANLFSLDNDLRSAMDAAAARDRMDCVRFLDEATARQGGKKAARLRQQATKEAERRVKLCEKVKRRHQSKMDRLHGDVAAGTGLGPRPSTAGVNEQLPRLTGAADTKGSLSARVKGTLQGKLGRRKESTAEGQPPSQGNVIFGRQENGTRDKPEFVDLFEEEEEGEEGEGGPRDDEDEEDDGDGEAMESIFNRPGLGNMVFRKNFSREMGVEPEEMPSGTGDDLGFRIRSEEDIGLDEDDEETSALAGFLAALGLLDYGPVLTREHLDIEALLLCSDADLKGLRIQLGPRKKILEAASRRRAALEGPGALRDSPL
ncbi:hypothetical protein AAFF_G00212280 [Aldrovandia affinis]|uniref:SAM domain-containing protein n=1 Tax=Aldrovandia affinis TaxID=143900 RepID=A0AAD7W5V1_9TELE|nr:hypothetical protein AAFF_G00212280 [Aldrovandia affinis]